MQNLLNDLESLLADDPSLTADGKLLKNAVIERAAKLDAGLLKRLMGHSAIRAHFFADVDGVAVFDKVKFQDFVSNKAFLPDSYTAYRNRIGLTDRRGRFLKDSDEVVLAWPYKDCVLEGGQTKEDRGRNEVFWNTTLAPDDISRLFEPKVLTNLERWDSEAVKTGTPKAVAEIGRDDNLLIKGNNLLALHTLEAKFAGQIKLIYIDPPYNTGRDEFKYNDTFRHSSWLVFMKNRLEIAKRLLRTDGAIFVQIGDGELGYLKVLMDEVFPGQFINQISIRTRSPSGFKTVNQGVFESAEYVLVYGSDRSRWVYRPQHTATDYDRNYSGVVKDRSAKSATWEFSDIGEETAASLGYVGKIEAIKAMGKPAFDFAVASWAMDNADRVFRLTAVNDDAGAETLAAKAKSLKQDGVIEVPREGRSTRYVYKGQEISFYESKIRVLDGVRTPTSKLTNIWTDIAWEGIASEGGVKLAKGKKPERLLRRIIDMATEPGDIVLDFFAGSGTTAAVAHKMGRLWVAVEQLDYVRNLTVKRLKGVIGGEQTGVSKLTNWQGGGAFVYAELAEWNGRLGDEIRGASTSEDLARTTARLRANGFVRPGTELAALDEVCFAALSLEDQKRLLLEVLDANHLYVNVGDMADETYGISAKDQEVNRLLQDSAT